MISKTIKNIDIELTGWFHDIYDANKPKGMSDKSYVNAMISKWLMDRDEQYPIPKTSKEKGKHEKQK